MRRSEYYEKHRNLNLDSRELERKYQVHLREEEMNPYMYEALQQIQIQSGASSPASGPLPSEEIPPTPPEEPSYIFFYINAGSNPHSVSRYNILTDESVNIGMVPYSGLIAALCITSREISPGVNEIVVAGVTGGPSSNAVSFFKGTTTISGGATGTISWDSPVVTASISPNPGVNWQPNGISFVGDTLYVFIRDRFNSTNYMGVVDFQTPVITRSNFSGYGSTGTVQGIRGNDAASNLVIISQVGGSAPFSYYSELYDPVTLEFTPLFSNLPVYGLTANAGFGAVVKQPGTEYYLTNGVNSTSPPPGTLRVTQFNPSNGTTGSTKTLSNSNVLQNLSWASSSYVS